MSAPLTPAAALAVLADPPAGARVQVFDSKKGFWRVGVLLCWREKRHRRHVEVWAEVKTPARARPFKASPAHVRPCPR